VRGREKETGRREKGRDIHAAKRELDIVEREKERETKRQGRCIKWVDRDRNMRLHQWASVEQARTRVVAS
jgi:hypothetical protein